MIEVTFAPVRMDDDLEAAAAGDVLLLNGALFDFGQLAEGDVLPREAVGFTWLVSDVTRTGGVVRLTVLRPHAVDAPEADRFPAALVGAASGALDGEDGEIDWGMLQTAASRASAELTAWRAQAWMSRTDFCLALAGAGILNAVDAISAAKGDIPAAFEAVVAALPSAQATEVRIRWAAMTEVDRANPFVALIAQAAGISDAAIDQVFGGA